MAACRPVRGTGCVECRYVLRLLLACHSSQSVASAAARRVKIDPRWPLAVARCASFLFLVRARTRSAAAAAAAAVCL